MSADPVISVENVSKAYRIWRSPAARMTGPMLESTGQVLPASGARRWLQARAAASYRDFWALREVSFQVRAGESVGIIGRNGSGKSTLLQIIAGTLQPSVGSACVNGRVAALLELGSGFNPDFTGRENVYLNAAVLGLSRREVDERFDQIAAFADIGDFIDQPVKTYSSGMTMRLAFAVQTAVEPDILIVDEALSVGDAPFQAKCFKRMRGLLDSGVTILFVSHDISTVRAICRRAICLAEGQVYSQGEAKTVCDDYQLLCMREQGIVGDASPARAMSPTDIATEFHRQHGPRNQEFSRQADIQRAGSRTVRLVDCYLTDQTGRPLQLVEPDQTVQVCWLLEAREAIRSSIAMGMTIKTLKGSEVLSCTDKTNEHVLELRAGQLAFVTMPVSFPLRSERYYITTSLFSFPTDRKYLHGTINFEESELLDLVEYSCYFEVSWNRRWAFYGPVQLDSQLIIKPLSAIPSS